jgi:hypothetical protein
MLTNALYSVKEVTIPALSSMIINTKFKGLICDAAQPIATVHAPQHRTISGMPAWVKFDSYKNCKFIGTIFVYKSSNIKVNINDVCNLISKRFN